MNSNLKTETMDAAGDMGLERRSTERRSAAYMIQATNYELAIRERDEALAKVAQLEARQAPIQSAELAELRKRAELAVQANQGKGISMNDYFEVMNNFEDAASPAAVLRLLDALAAVPAQQQASTVPAGWRAVIDQARDSICAGGLAEYVEHERGIVGPHLDGVYDALDALEKEVAPAHALTDAGWQPIETAPKDGRTVLLGRFNSLGKWRTMRGQWFKQSEIDSEWEDPDGFEAGWYETAVEPDAPNCWSTAPTHWQPLPAAPGAHLARKG